MAVLFQNVTLLLKNLTMMVIVAWFAKSCYVLQIISARKPTGEWNVQGG